MKNLLLAALSAFFMLLVLIMGGIGWAYYWYGAPGTLQDPVTIIIEPGTSSKGIGDKLQENGVIDNAWLFRAMTIAEGSHTKFKAGEYAFANQISPQRVAEILVKGESITHAVTIPEGKSTAEIIAILMADDRMTGIIEGDIPEGSLLPDTHHIHRGDSRQSVVDRMMKAQQELLAELWEARRPDLPVKTPQEAVILASIVEKETGVDGERRKVASVFVNRLQKGMPLQSDPTVVYAIERDKGPMERPLYRKDWQYKSPYNTYQNAGLPPGPICHPGTEALKATLNPAKEEYLFFVATGTGGHFFAKTLGEHNRNIARYKQNLRQTGE